MEFVKQSFADFRGAPSFFWQGGRVYENVKFVECSFRNCWLSPAVIPRKRTVVRNAHLEGCSQSVCELGTCVLEDVVVNSLRCSSALWGGGGAFKHVVLRGRIDSFCHRTRVNSYKWTSSIQAAFDQANAEFYTEVDWALDIRDALFRVAEIQGIPAELVRRDTETQVVVKREKAASWDLDKLDKHVRERIELRLKNLESKPVPKDSKFTGRVGGDKVFRYRIGDYRALYKIKEEEKIILVAKIDKRPRIYKR